MKIFNVFFAAVIAFIFAAGCFGQFLIFDEDRETESKVEQLLLKKDVGELANELARKNSGQTIDDLLIKLSVFARAGHRERVYETLRETGKIYPSAASKDRIFRVARRAVWIDDFTGLKLFYENIGLYGDDRMPHFVYLWRQKGDIPELERWLKTRSNVNESWWHQWVELKKSLGTEYEIAEELKRKIEQNPRDFSLVEKYLHTVSTVYPSSIGLDKSTYNYDISWLADSETANSASGAFEIGRRLKANFPQLTERLLEKSLSMPFTEKDRELYGRVSSRGRAVGVEIKNPEKEMRYRTKVGLTEIYRETGQVQRAQTLAEELTSTDTSDIEAESPFYVGGAVQAASGQRVIESKILQNEATGGDSPDYWIKRARYYAGRREPDLVLRTLTQALEKFLYVPNDYEKSQPRLEILYYLSDLESKEDAVEDVLRREFSRARAENDLKYLYTLLRLIDDNFDRLMNEFFVNNDLFPKVLETREVWRNGEEEFVISNVLDDENWTKEKREELWNQLTFLANKDLKSRAYGLASVMSSESEYKRAVSLLEKCLKIAPKETSDDWIFDRDEVERDLFNAYVESGDWKKAEKMFFEGFRYRGNELGRIAAAAAKRGDLQDAVRLWKINANLDRRNISEIGYLIGVAVKYPLREFYLDMKKRDPLTDAPDKVLLNLQ